MSNGANLGRQLSRAVVLFHQAVAARIGLSAGDLKTLDLIEQEGPFSASDLAHRTGLTGAAITSVIARLATGGHVTREVDPVDRRRAVIRAVTPSGDELELIFARLGEQLGALFADYSTEQQSAIVDYLHRTIQVMREQTMLLSKDWS